MDVQILSASMLRDLERRWELELLCGRERARIGRLEASLDAQGCNVSHQTVARMLSDMGVKLRVNAKRKAGPNHSDRNRQFEHLAEQVDTFHAVGDPVSNFDTKEGIHRRLQERREHMASLARRGKRPREMQGVAPEKPLAAWFVMVAVVVFAVSCGANTDLADEVAVSSSSDGDIVADVLLMEGPAPESALSATPAATEGSNESAVIPSHHPLEPGVAAALSPLIVSLDAESAPVVGQPLAVSVTMSLQADEDSMWWPIDPGDGGVRGSVSIAMGNEFAVSGGSPSNYVVELSSDSDQTRVFWDNVVVPRTGALVVSATVTPLKPTEFSLFTGSFNQRGTRYSASSELYAGVGGLAGQGYITVTFSAEVVENYMNRYAESTPSTTMFSP